MASPIFGNSHTIVRTKPEDLKWPLHKRRYINICNDTENMDIYLSPSPLSLAGLVCHGHVRRSEFTAQAQRITRPLKQAARSSKRIFNGPSSIKGREGGPGKVWGLGFRELAVLLCLCV